MLSCMTEGFSEVGGVVDDSDGSGGSSWIGVFRSGGVVLFRSGVSVWWKVTCLSSVGVLWL